MWASMGMPSAVGSANRFSHTSYSCTCSSGWSRNVALHAASPPTESSNTCADVSESFASSASSDDARRAKKRTNRAESVYLHNKGGAQRVLEDERLVPDGIRAKSLPILRDHYGLSNSVGNRGALT